MQEEIRHQLLGKTNTIRHILSIEDGCGCESTSEDLLLTDTYPVIGCDDPKGFFDMSVMIYNTLHFVSIGPISKYK